LFFCNYNSNFIYVVTKYLCFSKNISIVCNNLKGIYYFSGLLLKSEESVEVLKLLRINWAALKVEPGMIESVSKFLLNETISNGA